MYDLLTFTQSFRALHSASQTSGTIREIDCFDTRKRYCKLIYESPVAKNLKVIANLSVTEIASRNCVSIFFTCASIYDFRCSNSIVVNLVKFFIVSSMASCLMSSISFTPYCIRFKYNFFIHQRGFRLGFFLIMWCITMKAAAARARDTSMVDHGPLNGIARRTAGSFAARGRRAL